jgi:hypothetical protein
MGAVKRDAMRTFGARPLPVLLRSLSSELQVSMVVSMVPRAISPRLL